MGVLKKILDGAPEPKKFLSIEVDRIPKEIPAPCQFCRTPVFWRSIYDHTLRCGECFPWPALSLVSEIWHVTEIRDGEKISYDWEESKRFSPRAGQRASRAAT